jgi:hypothetical protein
MSPQRLQNIKLLSSMKRPADSGGRVLMSLETLVSSELQANYPVIIPQNKNQTSCRLFVIKFHHLTFLLKNKT